MLNIVTVLKTGGDFTPEYVYRLKEGVDKHLEQPHYFYCYTDHPELENERGVIYLQDGWPGWWSKFEMYRMEPPFLYLDLDTVINGPLDPVVDAAFGETFVCIKPVFQERPGAIASGMMYFDTPTRGIYDKFKEEAGTWMRMASEYATPPWNNGDQRVLELMGIVPSAYWQNISELVAHRKVTPLEDRKHASVIWYSGKPRPHETGWAI